MRLAELAALVMPKAVRNRKARKAKAVRAQGRRNLGYHVLTDTFRPIPWACDDPEALTEAEAHNVLASHKWADHAAGTCAITRTALAVLERATAAELSAKRIRETAINAPTVRTKAVSETELAALIRMAALWPTSPTRPVTVAARSGRSSGSSSVPTAAGQRSNLGKRPDPVD
ncbi:hypothetical protein [Nocardia brasiliensis]|uniref:hypothetical protein n=1 Tax=Nocardia brasiliensis TaxID=37326 RepID=UPI0024556A0D|nr:hypothetical protein [Nocardia brasiliensis]